MMKVIGVVPTNNIENIENDPYQDRASFVTMYIDKIVKCGGLPIGILDSNIKEYTDSQNKYDELLKYFDENSDDTLLIGIKMRREKEE